MPPGHRKSAVFATIVQPLQDFEADAAREAAPQLAAARRARHAAEQALLRAETAATLASDDQHDALIQLAQRRADDLAAIPAPVVPRLIVDDCSPERLATLLHQQGGRLAILSPEGGIFDLIAGRYSTTGAPNLDHVLKGHAGDPIIVDRVGRPGEIVPHPALTIGLAVQPEVLRGLIARPGFHGRGLLARFLYAVPDATLGTRLIDPDPVDAGLRNQYRRHIHALLHHLPTLAAAPPAPDTPTSPLAAASPHTPTPSRAERACDTPLSSRAERACERSRGISPPRTAGHPPLPQHPAPRTQHPVILPFADPAATRLRDFARSIEPRLAPTGDLGPIVDWGSKLVGAVARIAGLLHLAEHASELPQPPAPVSLIAVESAITLAEYLVAHARAAYDAMGLDPALTHAPVLLAWLQRSGPSSFTRRDALRAAGRHLRSPSHLDDALEELEHHGYICQRPYQHRPGQGRPPGPTYDVHPSLART